MGEISELPLNSGYSIFEEIFGLLKYETSSKVLSQGLSIFIRNQKLILAEDCLKEKIVVLAKSKLCSSKPNIQRSALLVIGTFTVHPSTQDVQLVGEFSESPDARVRAQALSSILMMFSKNVQLAADSLYTCAKTALKDDYECVRKEALQLIFEIGNRYPENVVLMGEPEHPQIRLVDDAFGKICSALCDLSMHVSFCFILLLPFKNYFVFCRFVFKLQNF